MYQYNSIRLTLLVGVFFSMAYVAVFVTFLCVVCLNVNIAYGYLRPDLKPGPFVSDRYDWGWAFLLLTLFHGVVPFFYAFTLIGLKDSYKRVWFERIATFFLLLDVVLLIFFVVVICFLCNSTYFPESLCDDPRWCEAFGPDHPDRCPPVPPTLQQCDLSPNPVFLNWIWFTIAFLGFDLVLFFLNLDLNRYVQQFMWYYRGTYL